MIKSILRFLPIISKITVRAGSMTIAATGTFSNIKPEGEVEIHTIEIGNTQKGSQTIGTYCKRINPYCQA